MAINLVRQIPPKQLAVLQAHTFNFVGFGPLQNNVC